MYGNRSGLVLGFHGCDEQVARDVISLNTDLRESSNNYDWLGHGIYFWENSPARALEFATYLKDNPGRANRPIVTPAVLGAIISPGYCFDLIDFEMLQLLKSGFNVFKTAWENDGRTLPANREAGQLGELLLRDLDCAVIETIHHIRRENTLQPFDSVRGVFWEGSPLYENAGFKEKNHIQLCVRNPNCIKGYFLPRTYNPHYSRI